MTKKFVHKKEIREEWNDVINSIKSFEKLLERPLRYSIWITNLSFGLLGFYSALLLNIRGKAPINDKFWIIITYLIISSPILIGMIIRLRYEITNYYSGLKKFLKDILNFVAITEKMFDMEDDEKVEGSSISWELLDKWKLNPPLKWILIQFGVFILGLFFSLKFLFAYLFS